MSSVSISPKVYLQNTILGSLKLSTWAIETIMAWPLIVTLKTSNEIILRLMRHHVCTRD